jgi:hypothetical protein
MICINHKKGGKIMGKRLVDIRTVKVCAFCKHWYDPTNSAISPKIGHLWEFDTEMYAKCMKNNLMRRISFQVCNMFERKM